MLTPGTRLGSYEVIGVLGTGGMGEVYRARDLRLNRDVAVKVLPDRVASDPAQLARFEREARLVASLNHPHIVTIHSIEQMDALRFLTMELVNGQSLDQLIPPPVAPSHVEGRLALLAHGDPESSGGAGRGRISGSRLHGESAAPLTACVPPARLDPPSHNPLDGGTTVLMRTRAILVTLVAVGLTIATARLAAITYGFIDTNNAFGNTGAFIVESPTTGNIFPICSGTLIATDVFLTASHCTAFFEIDLQPRGFTAFVSFDQSIPFGSLTTNKTRLVPVTHIVTNPAFNQAQNDSGDIAVLIVNARHTRGITPAALPDAGLLDRLAAERALDGVPFTNAGYGLQNRVVGGGVPFFQDVNPIPRMFSFSTFNALNPTYLRLSQNPATGDGGTCFGDSGGPQFLDVAGTRTIVSITITGDAVCQATNVTYRLDTPSARNFLSAFVPLP